MTTEDRRDHASEAMNRREFLRLGGAVGAAALGGGLLLDSLGAGAAGATEHSARSARPVAPTRGGTLRFATAGGAASDTADPALAFDSFTIYTACLLYDTLVHADVNFDLAPSLASDWTSNPSATTWTFKLRGGVQFHDGSLMTSADVAYSIKRILVPKLASPVYGNIQPFVAASGISTPDPSTIVFHLTAPNAFFPQILALANFGVIPEGTTSFAKPVGTGPFVLESLQPLANALFTRNDSYWKSGQPYLNEVQMVVIEDDSTRTEALLGGSEDFIDNVTGNDIELIERSSRAKQMYIAAGGWEDLAGWSNKTPFNDPLVVQALKHAENREVQMNAVLPGGYQVGPDVPVPISDPFFPSGLKAYPYDPDYSQHLLRKAGYKDGLDLTLYAYQGDKLDDALAYQQTAKAAGINIHVVTWPHATYWTQVYLAKPFIGDSWARLHTSVILQEAFVSQPNEFHWDSPGFNSLCAAALRTTDEARQKTLYGDALTILNEHCSGLIPGWVHQVYGAGRNVEGVELTNGGQVYFDTAYLT
jgi:peptide/nickel transport system substrate-binding protein